jgi:hypothetical protein
LHLFYHCPYIERIQVDFFPWAYHREERYTISRSDLFTVNEGLNEGESQVKTLTSNFFLKYIWDCKLRFTFLDLEDAEKNEKLLKV